MAHESTDFRGPPPSEGNPAEQRCYRRFARRGLKTFCPISGRLASAYYRCAADAQHPAPGLLGLTQLFVVRPVPPPARVVSSAVAPPPALKAASVAEGADAIAA